MQAEDARDQAARDYYISDALMLTDLSAGCAPALVTLTRARGWEGTRSARQPSESRRRCTRLLHIHMAITLVNAKLHLPSRTSSSLTGCTELLLRRMSRATQRTLHNACTRLRFVRRGRRRRELHEVRREEEKDDEGGGDVTGACSGNQMRRQRKLTSGASARASSSPDLKSADASTGE